MSPTLHVLVSLKIPDAIANTASNTLRRRMGFEDMKKLSRAEWWEVEFADGVGDAESLLRELVERTSLFMNPNKHRYELVEGEALSQADPNACRILVQDSEDTRGQATLEVLARHPKAAGKLSALHSGTLWTVTADSTERAREIAESIATTTGRTRGLLANPHYQTARVAE